MGFNQPRSGGSYIKTADVLGKLLLIRNVDKIDTRYDEMSQRERDEAHVTLVVLDGDASEVEGIITHQFIVNRLKAGDKDVLGRVVQLKPKKPGQNGAIVLDNFTDADAKVAQAWIDAHDETVDEALSILEAGLSN